MQGRSMCVLRSAKQGAKSEAARSTKILSCEACSCVTRWRERACTAEGTATMFWQTNIVLESHPFPSPSHRVHSDCNQLILNSEYSSPVRLVLVKVSLAKVTDGDFDLLPEVLF